MSISMTEQELRDLGLHLDPGDPTRAIPVDAQSESIPDDSWGLEQLGNYAATGLNEADRLLRESIQLGRRSTVQIFRSGHALAIARQKVQWGEWGSWLATHSIKRTTAWEAIQLYLRAGSEEAIANLPPELAKSRYGIGKPPRMDTQEIVQCGAQSEATPPLNPSSDPASQSEDESDDGEPEDAEPNDEQSDEPDLLVSPPRTLRAMLIAASNLLLACEQRSGEIDAACGDILAEINASVNRLLAEVIT